MLVGFCLAFFSWLFGVFLFVGCFFPAYTGAS